MLDHEPISCHKTSLSCDHHVTLTELFMRALRQSTQMCMSETSAFPPGEVGGVEGR